MLTLLIASSYSFGRKGTRKKKVYLESVYYVSDVKGLNVENKKAECFRVLENNVLDMSEKVKTKARSSKG